MNGKMREGSMFRIAELPKTKRQITARLPVQKAIGSPSISKSARPPNRTRLSQPIESSMPIWLCLPAREQREVLDQLRNALQHDQRRADRDRELHRPVLHRPLGEGRLVVLHRVRGELPA